MQDSVTIPSTLEKMIEGAGLLHLDPEVYVFGKHFKPNIKKIAKLDYFSDQQRDLNNTLSIGKGANVLLVEAYRCG